jgi:hypothetical protein
MIRAWHSLIAVAAVAFVLGGCKEEPTIVIKFEPNDLSAPKPLDLSTRAAAAALPDGGAAVVDEGKATKPGKGAAECKVAADCVAESVDCCGCNNGGKQHAIAKAKAAASAAKRKAHCAHTMCPMVISNDPSCSQVPACVQGACVLTAATKK